jgi:phage gp36-like protein
MPYATAQNMLDRYDNRRLGQLVRDDGTEATSTQLLSDTILAAALSDAASILNSAIFRGNRYLPTDLAALTGDDQALLIRVNCDLAFGLLHRRRGFTQSEIETLAPGYKDAVLLMGRLELGDAIFNTTTAPGAGVHVTPVPLSSKITLVSSRWRYFGILNNEQFPQG